MKKTLTLLSLALFLTSCSRKVAKVGSTLITSKDLSYRAKVSEIYYPGSGKDYVALAQLIKGFLAEEVLKKLGYTVDEKVIESEAKRIDARTKAPQVLSRVKKVYGRSKKAYFKTFVRIVHAERYLYNEVFLKSPAIHQRERERAEEFLNKVKKNPGRFRKIASQMNLTAKKLIISEEKGIVDVELAGKEKGAFSQPSGVGQAKYIIEKIKGTEKGKVYPGIIEWVEGYQVIRVLDKRKGEYTVESASIPKKEYGKWFWKIARDVPVWVYDKDLKEKLIKNISWFQKVNLM